MLKKTLVSLSLAIASSMALAAESAHPLSLKAYQHKPRLVVVLVIDQFRADYLTRFAARFKPAHDAKKGWGGFRYLMESGAYFPFAEYDLLQNMTCPGHATILTGARPYAHHIPINEWFDPATDKEVYCVDDKEAPLVGSSKPQPGVSPRLLAASTFGDELKSAGFQNHEISISLKDRAAVMLGGHRADLALWFDNDHPAWISSHYYLPKGELPEWVANLNKKIQPRLFKKSVWHPTDAETGLSNPYDKGDFSREASYGSKESLRTPVGLELTNEAAIDAIHSYQLGSHPQVPDLLTISYSSHDMMGHKVGPNAREMEELTVAEDASLSELFNAIEKSVPGGMKETLIVLTGDHGMAPSVAFSMDGKVDAATVDQEHLVKNLNESLEKTLGAAPNHRWVAGFHSFNFYLNPQALSERKLSQAQVEGALKELLLRENATEYVVTSTEVHAGHLPPGFYGQQVANTYVPGVSGDVILIPKPFFMEEGEPVTHMTGYSYDRTVPMAFAGPNIVPGVYAGKAHVIDIAPTLSFLMGVLPPSKNEGRVLSEALGSDSKGR